MAIVQCAVDNGSITPIWLYAGPMRRRLRHIGKDRCGHRPHKHLHMAFCYGTLLMVATGFAHAGCPPSSESKERNTDAAAACGPTRGYTATFLFKSLHRKAAGIAVVTISSETRRVSRGEATVLISSVFPIIRIVAAAAQCSFELLQVKQYAEMFRQHACARHHRRTDVLRSTSSSIFPYISHREINTLPLQIIIPDSGHGCAGSCIGNRPRHACVHDFPLAGITRHAVPELNLVQHHRHWRTETRDRPESLWRARPPP